MKVGMAVLLDGEAMIVHETHGDDVTLRDENGACVTVTKDRVTEV